MQWDILATILLTATIQSLFGVGVLLFGTPILLVLGYDFITALTILLPISLTINLLQVSKDYRYIQWPFYRQILTLSIPCVVLCLLLVTTLKLNIGSIVGLFLIVAALKSDAADRNYNVGTGVETTIKHDLPKEAEFLRRYDAFRSRLALIVDMPERVSDLLFRFLNQNDGRLSQRAREKEFAALTHHEAEAIQRLYAETFKPGSEQ